MTRPRSALLAGAVAGRRLADLREGLLHVITEAAAHTVHLDGYGN
jgi:hypothetical protein